MEITQETSTPHTAVASTTIPIPATPTHGPLTLRPWHPSLTTSLQSAANNPSIRLWLRDRMPSPYTLADAEWWIAHNQDPTSWYHVRSFDSQGGETVGEKLSTHFAITAPGASGEEEAVGSIGVEMGGDVARRSGELGYWLAEQCWGRGIMPDVVRGVMGWVWEAFPGLVRVHSEVFALNERSAGVLRRAGFEFEGRQRGAVWKNGVIGDALIYVALRPGLVY